MTRVSLLLILLIPIICFSQETVEREYFDSDWSPCDSTIAKHIKEYTFSDSIEGPGAIKKLTVDNHLISAYAYSNVFSEIKHGHCMSFFDSDTVKYNLNYRNDQLDGDILTYYSSGQTKRADYYTNGELIEGACYSASGEVIDWFPFEVLPEYKGGLQGLMKFLAANTTYPKKARRKGIQGTVYVTFVVTKTGKVADERILKSVHPLLDEEAMRVTGIMQDWIPGTIDGVPTNISFNLPIRFAFR